MAFTQVVVTGTFTTSDGDPARGRLRFTPTEAMTNGGVVVVAAPVVATLNAGGRISVSLAATDDADTVTASEAPARYLVEELLVRQRPRVWQITVPSSFSAPNVYPADYTADYPGGGLNLADPAAIPFPGPDTYSESYTDDYSE